MEVGGLWRIFKSYGVVIDIYMERRRLDCGKRFGFVEIGSSNLERTLNNIWVGSYKLRAFSVEKSEGRAEKEVVRKRVTRRQTEVLIHRDAGGIRHVGGQSYASVLRGRQAISQFWRLIPNLWRRKF
ncbi:hypothetical protein L6452_06917 [Arctium lappa]|uniref:Uncharacterized protein n=1 Tax=Arctium lappa TaxID=4217 RepID=A0ACB9EKN2_ARCLA|nr:hypothetical protein L6452_06917 [Arctium lappa]